MAPERRGRPPGKGTVQRSITLTIAEDGWLRENPALSVTKIFKSAVRRLINGGSQEEELEREIKLNRVVELLTKKVQECEMLWHQNDVLRKNEYERTNILPTRVRVEEEQ